MSVKHWDAVRAPHGWVMSMLVGSALLTATAVSAPDPAAAQAGQGRFGNDAVVATWKNERGTLANLVAVDERHHAQIEITDPFSVTFKDGRSLATSDFRLQGALREVALPVDAAASRLAERIPGKSVEGVFLGPRGNLRIDWKLVQRDGSDYLREVVIITALNADAPITRVSLFGANAPDAIVDGSVDGSPVVSHDDWLGFEHPMSKADAWRGKAKLWIERALPLAKGQSVTYSAVIGVAHAGR